MYRSDSRSITASLAPQLMGASGTGLMSGSLGTAASGMQFSSSLAMTNLRLLVKKVFGTTASHRRSTRYQAALSTGLVEGHQLATARDEGRQAACSHSQRAVIGMTGPPRARSVGINS